jgi:hypothetical protein
MAARTTERRLYLHSLHAHRGSEPLGDYEAMFSALSRLTVGERASVSPDRLTALRSISINTKERVHLIAYEGPPGLAPLIFNLVDNEERIEDLGDREVMATRTHAIVNLKNRDVAVEYNHRGAKARDLAAVIQEAGRRSLGWDDLIVELPPVASPDFSRSIDEFETIKLATLDIVRPNLNWVTEHNHAAKVAKESNAQRVEIAAFAAAGEGLAKGKGIVRLIKGLTKENRSNLRNATVSGRRPGEASDTSVSMARHLEHRVTRVRLGQGGHPETAAVEQRLNEFLDAREKTLAKRQKPTE